MLRPLLRGAAADRPVAPLRRPAPERLGLDRRLRRLDARSSSGGRCSAGAPADDRRHAPGRTRRAPDGAEDGRSRRAASGSAASLARMPVAVRELELDLDAFEGPFDLLLTLVLREELPLREIDLAEIVDRVRRASRRARRARPRRVRRVPRPDLGAARAEGARALPRRGRRARRARARGGRRGARAPARRVPAREGGGGLARASGSTSAATASSGSARRRSRRRSPSATLAPQDPEQLAAALRAARRRAAGAVRPRTWRFASRRSRSSSSAGARCCAAASRLDFDQEVAGLSRVEVAVAFLALLELRKQGEIAIAQAAPFAPIRISRPDGERSLSWTVHSA